MKYEGNYAERFLASPLADVDPFLQELVAFETIRQDRKIILIPSESICPRPVLEALASPFTNVYAEGFPPRLMDGASEEDIRDLEWQLINYRRYADRRFYKGCEYVHEIEALAKWRAAECFASDAYPPGAIYVNVQPLSGSAANNAVYEAFLEPGDLLMGMALPAGGHLTHGSELNRSGKRYRVVAYGVDPQTGRLDYEQIRRVAREHRPRMIVAGYTSYPWAPDWYLFREIADEVGAALLADIAHPAGLVVAGLYPNPVGIADAVTFTTHKTLCGPRGAVIMCTDEEAAQRIDSAVFPGEQGGPHVNKIAAMAVAFCIAKTEAFSNLQSRIVENAQALAGSLAARGVKLCYGGTNTHLLVIDLRDIGKPTGYPLMGEIAARILDLVGIVVNKNTIPGDHSAADARGIRAGTPWVSQRGMGPAEMDVIAEIISRVLQAIHPFTYRGVSHVLPRGKIAMEVLEEARGRVQDLLGGADPSTWDYPHDHGLAGQGPQRSSPLPRGKAVRGDRKDDREIWIEDHTDAGVLEIGGERAWAFLQEACTRDLTGLAPGEGRRAMLLDAQSRLLDDVSIVRRDDDTFYLLTHTDRSRLVCTWLRRLSEGYVLFDPEDILAKVQGPVRVCDRNDPESKGGQRLVAIKARGHGAEVLWRDRHHVVAFRMERDDGWLLLASAEEAKRFWEACRRRKRVGLWNRAAREARARDAGRPGLHEESRPNAVTLLKSHPERFDLNKPYFIGLGSLRDFWPPGEVERASFPAPQKTIRRSCLHTLHTGRAKKMGPFAGWEMPIWFDSILEEHRAVREAAGLFDVSHMGIIGLEGEDAAHFLDLITTNYVRWLRVGESQYSFLLDPEGGVIDDLIVFRTGIKQYMLVVNAANAESDLAWIHAAAAGKASLELERPAVRFQGKVIVRDLKEPVAGEQTRVDLALQGPASLQILLRLADRREQTLRLRRLKRSEVTRMDLHGIPIWISRTGYTGEPVGFEIYVHPEHAPSLWELILEAGEDLGVRPAGLGARDSLRTEAGLPLHGSELGGAYGIDPIEAGFAGFVKLHKPFFVGRKAMLARSRDPKRTVVRFRLHQQGVRMLHPGDLVVHRRAQQIIGWVTSASLNEERYQVGMALVSSRFAAEGTPIALVPRTQKTLSGMGEPLPGSRWPLHEEGVILSRFPGRG